jgi:hypothetical protein
MTTHPPSWLAVVPVALLVVACDSAETRNASITTSSPAGTSTAPSSVATESRENAMVRVVNAVPSGTTFDLFAGDLLLFDGLAFKTVTPYRAVDGKRYAFALRPAGMTQAKPLSSNTENLDDGDFYTAIAMPGEGHGPRLRVVSDPLEPPANGKARLRVVHAGTAAGVVDVRAVDATTALFDKLEYQTVSDYRDVAPMNGQLQIVGAGGAVPVSTTAHLEAGRLYTLVIVGNASAPGQFEAFLIEDALSP